MNKCDHLLLERHPTPALLYSIHILLYTYISTVSMYTYICMCMHCSCKLFPVLALREGPPSGVETMASNTAAMQKRVSAVHWPVSK